MLICQSVFDFEIEICQHVNIEPFSSPWLATLGRHTIFQQQISVIY